LVSWTRKNYVFKGCDAVTPQDCRSCTLIDRFEKEGMRKKVKFMVGGAPLTDRYAKEIGADGYAPDAASAAERFKAFVV
jgi:methanogenic corrinoid protein MtbC1